MTVEHTLRIAAPPDVVWAITEDVERWSEWTPTVTHVRRLDDGPFCVGSAAQIKQPMQPAAEWTVTEHVPGARFAWETRRAGLWMRGTHEVHATDDGSRSVLRVEARGMVAVLLWPLLWPATRYSIATENRGLRERAEQMARAGRDER